VLQFTTVRQPGESSNEHGDQPGCILEVGFVFIRTERAQRIQPFLRRPMLVEVPLFHFRRRPDPLLDRRIRNRNEVPGLLVRAARGGAGAQQALLDDRSRHRTIGELADGPTALQARLERRDPFLHDGGGQFLIGRQR
jgi:hypothetical protein